MKRTVQMKTGNAGGRHVSSTGCRHNPGKIRRAVRDILSRRKGADEREVSAYMYQISVGVIGESRQSLIDGANRLLSFVKSPERVR